MRVLVVEDEPLLCEVYQDFLDELGHHAVIARTAEEAVDHLTTERPDVILLDVHLPGMSGLEFLARGLGGGDGVPVLVISGVATEHQTSECLRLGAREFIGKPVSLERLGKALERVAGSTDVATRQPWSRDRRRAPRAMVSLPVRVTGSDGLAWEATSLDLSASGIRLKTRRPLRPAPTVTLALDVPGAGDTLELSSVLVRAGQNEQAYRFVNVADTEREQLARLVERASMETAVREAPHLAILHTIAEAGARNLDVGEMVAVALEALTDVTGHEMSTLHLLAADGQTLLLQGDRGLPPALREINERLPVGEGLIGRVAASGVTLHVADAAATPELLPRARAVVRSEGMGAFVCVPLLSQGRVLGTLSLGRRTPDPFTEAEIAVVEASASQIALALENRRLADEVRRRLEELQHAQTQLAEGARLSTVGKLAAGLAHEINNSLAAILGQGELMLARSEQAEPGRRRLRVILEETSRAAKLLQDFLQVSRHHAPERRPCALAGQVRFVLDLKAHQLQRDGVRVVTDFEDVPAVAADPHQFRQIVLNLVQNAHQAMMDRAGERVLTVRVVRRDAFAQLEVLDTGPGIPPEIQSRLFEAFFTTKPPGVGTGLGLWVSASLVAQHGGRLGAENRPEGGARFVVELPLV